MRSTNINIEITFTFSNLKFNMMRSYNQSSSMHKYIKSRYQREKLISAITIKIFLEKAEGSYVMAVVK